jgi:hypothetical protein
MPTSAWHRNVLSELREVPATDQAIRTAQPAGARGGRETS